MFCDARVLRVCAQQLRHELRDFGREDGGVACHSKDVEEAARLLGNALFRHVGLEGGDHCVGRLRIHQGRNAALNFREVGEGGTRATLHVHVARVVAQGKHEQWDGPARARGGVCGRVHDQIGQRATRVHDKLIGADVLSQRICDGAHTVELRDALHNVIVHRQIPQHTAPVLLHSQAAQVCLHDSDDDFHASQGCNEFLLLV
mmetsp:Transcript_48066/g.120982  ORF Transcript_48066/g.120982 Transcript_48066/m.120982 type:complete len:203 (-) Transcript_48066:414-1022(-)